MNCWSEGNNELRQKLLLSNNPDIICVCETRWLEGQTFSIPNYLTFAANRKKQSKCVNRGSGRIAILVKMRLASTHQVTKCLEIDDNILGVKLVCWKTNTKIVIFCVYLPPESSRYGQENELLLNQLTVEPYKHEQADKLVICGDFNAWIGNLHDALTQELPKRHVIDRIVNLQGQKLINFLCDTKFCIVNGRVNNQNDFISVSAHKGNAVGDYVIVRNPELHHVKDFSIVAWTWLTEINGKTYCLLIVMSRIIICW